MKTFLNLLLVVALAILAFKLLPMTIVAGCILALAVAILAAVGVSLVACGLYMALAIIALLAPVWLPVLAVVGAIAVIRRWRRGPVATG